MDIVIEAVYESGVLRPLSPLPDIKEHERVRVKVESIGAGAAEPGIIDRQRKMRISIDPTAAREIGDTHEYDLAES